MASDEKPRPLDMLLKDFKQLSRGAWVAVIALIVLLVVAIVGVYYSGTESSAPAFRPWLPGDGVRCAVHDRGRRRSDGAHFL
jgi:hypothetical protein